MGKTVLVFNGLCHHWGFYFTAAQDTNEIGADDLERSIATMSHTSRWTHDAFENPLLSMVQKASNANEDIAFKWVYKVLLTRWIIFCTFIEVARKQNGGNLPLGIKHDWLLFQILPIVLIDDRHPFLSFLNSCLVGMAMEDLIKMLNEHSLGRVLGPAFNSESDVFFYILDEAQVTDERYMGAFTNANAEIRRPVLHPIIRVWHEVTSIPSVRFIVSGTGFLLSLFKMVLMLGVSKARSAWEVVHKTGDFVDRSLQESYISRYLPPVFLSSPSGSALISRMYEWLCGQ